MKKVLALLLAPTVLMGLFAGCGEQQTNESKTYTASEDDIAHLDNLYAGYTPYYGELHDHSDSGGHSDGRCSLAAWKAGLKKWDMDFAAIVDHEQVTHMYHEDWDNTIFIGGTEPANVVLDSKASYKVMHYNMIFSDPKGLENVLNEYKAEFQFNGEYFQYYYMDTATFQGLIQCIKDNGGLFVHVHPKSPGVIDSQDSLDYWFADWTGLEVFYAYKDTIAGPKTAANYQLWTDLLALGKKVWATAGSDEHDMPTPKALTTIYSTQKHADSYMEQLRVGNFVCGGVGIRMCVGDTAMGSQCSFKDQRLVFSVGDFHRTVFRSYYTYRVDLFDDTGIVFSKEIPGEEFTGDEPLYFAMDTREDAKFYRVEVTCVEQNLRIAIGNPIWNEAY